jgi:hypothetical protein
MRSQTQPGLVEIVRRHEKTAKDNNGKKLDRPTPEGLTAAYERGIQLRQEYPDHVIEGRHSKLNRTQIACAAWLSGAGALPLNETMRYEQGLDSVKMDPEVKAQVRNLPKEELQESIFGEYVGCLKEAGARVANHLANSINEYHHETDQPTARVNVSHGPIIDVAYLMLQGEDITLENAKKATGLFNEGTGFELSVKKQGPIYVAELGIGDKKQEYELRELLENAQEYL